MKYYRVLIRGWRWDRPEGHEDQPLVSWWAEQSAALILAFIGVRAIDRKAWQTFRRINAIVSAASAAEAEERA